MTSIHFVPFISQRLGLGFLSFFFSILNRLMLWKCLPLHASYWLTVFQWASMPVLWDDACGVALAVMTVDTSRAVGKAVEGSWVPASNDCKAMYRLVARCP